MIEEDFIIVGLIINNNIDLINLVELNFKEFDYTINESYSEIEKEYISLSIKSNNSSKIEEICDYLRINNKNIRYQIKVFKSGKKFPNSIKINKQNKKIYTKKKNKYYFFK
jgi:hypothetical protein